MTTFLYDVGVVVAKKLAEMVDSVYDLSLIRSVLEVYWRPQEGALAVQSNRYLMLSAGGAKPGYPYSAYRDPTKRIQEKIAKSDLFEMGPTMEDLIKKLPKIVNSMAENYVQKYNSCVNKRSEFDGILADLKNRSNGNPKEAPCAEYKDLKNKFWDPKTEKLEEADLGFKDNCKCASIDDVDNEALKGYDSTIDMTNLVAVEAAKNAIINDRKKLKKDLLEKANELLKSIASLRSEPLKFENMETYKISRSLRYAPKDYVEAIEAAFSDEKCKDSAFFKYAYGEKNAITDSRADLTLINNSVPDIDVLKKALYRRVALNLVEGWGMVSQAIDETLDSQGAIVKSQIAQKPAKPVSDKDLEKDNMWKLYVSSLEFEEPLEKTGNWFDHMVSDSKFDPLSKINLKVPYNEYNAWGNQKTGQILFGTGTTLSMKRDGTISELDTRYNGDTISMNWKDEDDKKDYGELNRKIRECLTDLKIQ
jgi:hypothetical protein